MMPTLTSTTFQIISNRKVINNDLLSEMWRLLSKLSGLLSKTPSLLSKLLGLLSNSVKCNFSVDLIIDSVIPPVC